MRIKLKTIIILLFTFIVFSVIISILWSLKNEHAKYSEEQRLEKLQIDFARSNQFLDYTTVGVKSFGRVERVITLLTSIFKYYPTIRVVVVDDGEKNMSSQLPVELVSRVKIYQIPFDSGLAAGRNVLVSKIETPYMVYVDEDFEFIPETKIGNMISFLDKYPVDVVSGTVTDRLFYIGFTFKKQGRDLKLSLEHKWTIGDCKGFDIVPNFFAAKVKSLESVGWDPYFKLGEHEDFFLRAIGRLNVASCPSTMIKHNSDASSWEYRPYWETQGYGKYRHRSYSYQIDFLIKHNFDRYLSMQDDVFCFVPKDFSKENTSLQTNPSTILVVQLLGKTKLLSLISMLCVSIKTNLFIKKVVILTRDNIERPVISCHGSTFEFMITPLKQSNNSDGFLQAVSICKESSNDACMIYLDMKTHYLNFTQQLHKSYQGDTGRIHWCTNSVGNRISKFWTFQNVDSSISTSLVSSHGCGFIFHKRFATSFFDKLSLIRRKSEKQAIERDTLIFFSLWLNMQHKPLIVNLPASLIIGQHGNGLHSESSNALESIKLSLFNYQRIQDTTELSSHVQYVSSQGYFFNTNITIQDNLVNSLSMSNFSLQDGDMFAKMEMLYHNSFISAIDSNMNTSWKSPKVVQAGDWIKIDITGYKFILSILLNSSQINRSEFSVLASTNDFYWLNITSRFSYENSVQTQMDGQQYNFLKMHILDMQQDISFRYLKFVFEKSLDEQKMNKLFIIRDIQVFTK